MHAGAASLHLLRTDPLRAGRLARSTLPEQEVEGLLHAQPVATATLTWPTPWRYGVLCAWSAVAAVAPLHLGRREVPPAVVLVPRQVRGSWRGIAWTPGAADGEDEEVVAFVGGRLVGRHVARFFGENVGVAAVARRSPGFLHGMGLFESPLRFASFSRWRTAEELRRFAYAPGPHREVVRPYKATPWATDHVAVRFGVVPRPGRPAAIP